MEAKTDSTKKFSMISLTAGERQARYEANLAKYQDELFTKLKSSGHEKLIESITQTPKRFRLRRIKSLLGIAGAAEERRAGCEDCVGWENVVQEIGSCTTRGCSRWMKRPYQKTPKISDSEIDVLDDETEDQTINP